MDHARVCRLSLVLGLTAVLGACREKPSPSNEAPATAASGGAVATAPVPSAQSSAAAASSAAAPASISPMPEVAEFRKAREIPVAGSTALGCETQMVREWLRVTCKWTQKVEAPLSLEVVSGGVPGKTVVTVKENELLQLLTPIPDKGRLEAKFGWWESRVHTLVIDRSAGVPEDQVTGSFSGFKVFPSPTEIRTSGKEVLVSGSSALGCALRIKDGWLLMECGLGGPLLVFDINVTRGAEEGSTQRWITVAAVTLLTPFHEGSSLDADVMLSDSRKKLTLSWPAGQPMPSPLGSVEGASPIPSEADFKAAPEVVVKGSTALGCSTRLAKGEWLRVVCIGRNNTGGTPEDVFPAESSAGAEDLITYHGTGVTSLTAKIGPGKKLEALFFWTDESYVFKAAWPAGEPQPKVLGEFEGAKSPLHKADAGG